MGLEWERTATSRQRPPAVTGRLLAAGAPDKRGTIITWPEYSSRLCERARCGGRPGLGPGSGAGAGRRRRHQTRPMRRRPSGSVNGDTHHETRDEKIPFRGRSTAVGRPAGTDNYVSAHDSYELQSICVLSFWPWLVNEDWPREMLLIHYRCTSPYASPVK